MTAQEALKLARTLMDKHGLHDWKIVINPRLRTTEARCVTGKKQIEISKFRLEWWDDPADPVEQAILHEIAHALHYLKIKDRDPLDLRPSETADHGEMWRTISQEIGYIVPDYYIPSRWGVYR